MSGLAVTANFFDTLGVRARLGRVFGAAEAAPERDAPFAVLSHAFWTRRFQAAPEIVGRTVHLSGHAYTVLGVLPERYRAVTGVLEPDVYVPLGRSTLSTIDERRNANGLSVIGRLRIGGTREQARQAVTLLGQRLEQAYPRDNKGFSQPARVLPLRGLPWHGAPREALLVPVLLIVMFGLLLAIACANVAGLLLARGESRRRDVAVRLALGAGRARVLQWLLAESVLLSCLGAAAGLLMTTWLLGVLGSLPPIAGQTVRLRFQPGAALYVYGAALALITGLLCGTVPAIRATTRAGAQDVLRGTGATTTGRFRLRHAFVVAQVAASVTLLIVSSLVLRSLLRVSAANPGFDVERGVVARIAPDAARVTAESRRLLIERALERVTATPGVTSASVANLVPLAGDSQATAFRVEERFGGAPATRGPRTEINSVGPRYFETLGIPLLRGREIGIADRPGAPPVVVVNEAFARQYFPDGDALGRRVAANDGEWTEIVGIVCDSSLGFIGEVPSPAAYYAWAQRPGALVVHARVAGPPAAVRRAMLLSLTELDPQAIVEVQTLREATSFELTMRRVATLLLGSLGLLGLLLAMVGLYGLVVTVVTARTVEIGIRMTLGASPSRIMTGVLAQGLRLVGGGVAIGASVSLLLTRPLAAFLAGLSPSDPLAFGGTAAILLLTGLTAVVRPAWRATRVDPVSTLRHH